MMNDAAEAGLPTVIGTTFSVEGGLVIVGLLRSDVVGVEMTATRRLGTLGTGIQGWFVRRCCRWLPPEGGAHDLLVGDGSGALHDLALEIRIVHRAKNARLMGEILVDAL